MEFKFSNNTLRFIIDKTPLGTVEQIKNFERKVSAFNTFVNSLPQKFELKQMSLEEWSKLSITDYKKADLQLQKEINEFIDFIWLIGSFKSANLLNAALEALEKDNFYVGMILCRPLIEVSCLTYNSIMKIKPIIDEMNKSTNDRIKYYELDKEREAITSRVYGGTRHKAILQGKADSVRAKSINDIEEVSNLEKYSTLKKKYSILSEIVHPDLSSNDLFGMIDIENIDPDKISMNENFVNQKISFIQNVEVIEYWRKLPEEYLIAHYPRFFGMVISVLDMCMDLIEESIKIGKLIRVDLVLDPNPIGELFYRADKNKQIDVIKVLETKNLDENSAIAEIMRILLHQANPKQIT